MSTQTFLDCSQATSNEFDQHRDAVVAAALSALDPNDRNVVVRMDRSEIVLRGRVESFFEKQRVQEAIRRADSRLRICNELIVVK